MTQPYDARTELRALLYSKISAGTRTDESVDAVMRLFYEVREEWDSIDISTMAEGAGTSLLDQRWIVVRIPRESVRRFRRPQRSVANGDQTIRIPRAETGPDAH